MKNHKSYYLKRILSLALASSMTISMLPVNVFANDVGAKVKQAVTSNANSAGTYRDANPVTTPDATSSATYYKKANWENKIKDKSRWKVEDSQNLVRVGGSDPVQMNDIDYDGMFIDANGRYVIRLVYKEKSQASSVVWYRALLNFGDLDKFIDYDLSYVLGKDGKTQYKFENPEGIVGKGFDLGKAAGDRTTNRKNLPINIVLKEGVDLNKLGNENYIVQMRVTDGNYKRVYAYAPGKTSMDYSTYTKTTSVDLVDKLGTLFIKGGKQDDHKNATNQEFFMSEFIANPDQYPDKSNLGIIRTQYMGQTNPIVRETIDGKPFAYTQVFDANLVKYLKADEKGNVGYVNVMTNGRELSPYTKNVGIPLEKINYTNDKKLAYIVIGTKDFKKNGVEVVEIPKNDQHTMLSGFYITAIDYVVDKSKFEDTFSSEKTRKLNYTMMSGWTNPNQDGWVVYEKEYDNDYVVPEGESYLIDTGDDPSGGQIMIQVGGDQAILRKPQGYYNGYVSGDGANDTIEKYANGVYKFTLREGATILKGKKLKVFMPYTSSHDKPVNFLEIHNGTKLNEGAATLTLQTDRNINMHLYTELPRGATFKLKYTLKGEKEQKELVFTKPKGIGTLWQYNDADKVLTGASNRSILSSGGNFYINTTKLEPGADIYVEAYDENGKEIVERKSWFKYKPLDKSQENVKELTWVDHSDKKSVLSVNKSLYTPYQLLFTNDYAEGTDDFYKEPRVLPAKNDDFNKDTKEFVGYTKYDGGKVRTLYAEGKTGKLFAKVEADSNEYDDNGNIKGKDVSKKITIPKSNIFDAQFADNSKEYTAYEYKVNLTKMLPYYSEDKTEKSLTLLKDMKFVSTASDGSSLPSDLYETRVRARVLFDATEGTLKEDSKDVKKSVKIVPDNVKFYGEDGYAANGFEGANVEANTGDKFPEAPTLAGKNFLGWVTEAGKTALDNKAVVTADAFSKLTKDQIFTNETPVTKHQVVYAIYSDETAVTFDANEGKFTDGKDITTAKVDNGSVAKPTDPTRDGYTFKGWAATKDATKADPNILNGVTAPKTVYAVWEKTDKEPLTLNDPEKVEVKDTKSLTSDEVDKVKKAVVEANKDKGITEADVTVAEDGTVTVTKDGKTGTLAPEKTVKQKEVQNNFNPPKEPVPVDKIGQLTNEEIGKIKQAVKEANPDRNFKDKEITVKPDGTVEINQGGKVGTIPAEKTVVQKDTILDLKAPDKTEVKDPTNLTKEERDAVAKAVKEKNSLPDTATITVDSKGNVTVKDGNKTGTLKAEDTVKPFTRDGKTLNKPTEKVKVADANKLTEAEKQAVKDAVKTANPELGFTDDEIQVDDNGTVTVPMGNTKVGNIPGSDTVEQAKDTDKIIKLVAPEKTEVADKTKLTKEEKDAVIAAVKKVNIDLPADATITVSDDGAVTVTSGTGENQKVGQLSQADTVFEKLKAPEVTALEDGSVVVTPKDDRSDKLEISFGDYTAQPLTATRENGKWTLPEGTDASIKIDPETGMVTIPASKLSNNEEVKAKEKAGEKVSPEAKANAKKPAEEKAPVAPTVEAKDNGDVVVTPPTDDTVKTIEVTYTPEGKTDPVTVKATKGEDGTWTVPAESGLKVEGGKIVVPADKVADNTEVKAVAKDAKNTPSKETDTSKAKAKTPEDKDAPQAPTVTANKDGSVTVTPPTDKDTKTVEVTYTDNDGNDKKVTATKGDDGKWSVPDGSDVTVDPKTGVITVLAEKVKDGTEVTAKAKDKAGNVSKEGIDTAKPVACLTKEALQKQFEDASDAMFGGIGKKEGIYEGTYDKENKNVTVKIFDKDKNAIELSGTGLISGMVKLYRNNHLSQIKIGEKGQVLNLSAIEKATTGITFEQTLKQIIGTELLKAVQTPDNQTGHLSDFINKTVELHITLHQEGCAEAGDVTLTYTIKGVDGTDKTAPATPKVEAKDDGSVTVTPPTDADTEKVEVTYTPEGATEPKTVTATKGDDGKWSVPEGSDVTVDPDKGVITIPAEKVKDGTDVTAKAKDKTGNESEAGTDKAKTPADKQAPAAPTVKANEDGSVTVTPPTDADTKTVEVTYTDNDGNDKKVTATKGDDGKWSVPDGSDVTVDPKTGVITVPADKVKDGTEVTAKAKDKAGNESKQAGKATAKTPADTQAPAAPTVEAKDNGDVTVTPPTDADTKTVEVTYTDNDGNDKKVTATKGDNGKWTVPEGSDVTVDPDTGVITVPADKVKDGTEVSAKAKDKTGNESKQAGKATAKKPADTTSPTVKAPDTLVKAENSKALTEDEKKAVEEEVRKANPDLPADAKITVGDDGTVTVIDKDGKVLGTIPAEKTVKQDETKLPVKAPSPVEVANPNQLTDKEKEAVKEAVKKANPDLEDAEITVDEKGKVTVIKDGKTGTLTPEQTVVPKGQVNKEQLQKAADKDPSIKDSDEYKNADPDKKKAYDDALKAAQDVLNDPDATQEEVNAAKDALEKAAKELNGEATDKSKLEAEANKENATKDSNKYKYADAAKKKAYDDALAKAKEVLNNSKASQAEVDAALDALQKAELALNGTKPSDGGTTPAYPGYPSYPSNPQTPDTTTENRVSGNDRIQTAIEISKKYFGHADTVIVVDSNNYADAITASVLSKILKAPILLTDTHKLDPRVGAEIERLGAKDVIIVGGHNSVADSVKGELKAYDEDSVERIWGNDRYETSAQVARRIVGITGKKGHAVIASGEVFADALAVGPYAAQQGYPILLVQAKNIPTTINKALKDLGIKNVTIAGGINTVSKSLENPLPNVVERLQGKSRYETAIAIAQSKFPQAKEAFLVNGEQWMDALVIAPVGGIMSKPILLTPSNNAPQSLKDYLIKSEIERLTAVGGNRMVSEQVLKELTKK